MNGRCPVIRSVKHLGGGAGIEPFAFASAGDCATLYTSI